MEGTKHEKVVILLLAYIIGFTAGYISFGVTQPNIPFFEQNESVPEFIIPAQASQSAPTPSTEPSVVPQLADSIEADYTTPKFANGTHVYYEDGRLFISIEGKVNLLSIERNKMSANVSDYFTDQGLHVSIPRFLMSDDKKFVYFCEQQSDEDSCSSFIYDTSTQTIQYVVADGQKISTSSSVAASARFNGSVLVLGSYVSTTPESPWKMAQN